MRRASLCGARCGGMHLGRRIGACSASLADLLPAAAAPLPWEIAAAEAAELRRAIAVGGLSARLLKLAGGGKGGERACGASGPEADVAAWGAHLEAVTLVLAEETGVEESMINERFLPTIPQLLRLGPAHVSSTVQRLESFLGGKTQVANAIMEEPLLLGYAAAEHLDPGILYLLDMTGAADEAAAARLVEASPGLLRWAVEGSLALQRFNSLNSDAKVETAGALASAARAASSIAGLRNKLQR